MSTRVTILYAGDKTPAKGTRTPAGQLPEGTHIWEECLDGTLHIQSPAQSVYVTTNEDGKVFVTVALPAELCAIFTSAMAEYAMKNGHWKVLP